MDALELYRGETEKPYFVDKTQMLAEMIFLVEHGRNYVAVTRPRRFGKSVVAAMIGAYFGKGADGEEVFSSLEIAKHENYEKHLNQHDLKEAYPDAKISTEDSIGAALRIISIAHNNQKFMLIFDEWDYVFHKDYFTESDRGRMADRDRYGKYFGFTDEEVNELYRRYLDNCFQPAFSRKELEEWYDGYHLDEGVSIYNPNSVVLALTRNKLNDYWTKGGEYDELKEYVLNDVDGVREAVMLLVADEPVEADISEYASTAAELKFRDEILSTMVVYGYLNYSGGCVRIPNKELALEFDRIIRTEPRYSYMRELKKESARILQATYDCDEETVREVIRDFYVQMNEMLSGH